MKSDEELREIAFRLAVAAMGEKARLSVEGVIASARSIYAFLTEGSKSDQMQGDESQVITITKVIGPKKMSDWDGVGKAIPR